MAPLEMVRIRVREREKKLHDLRHQEQLLKPTVQFAGPRERAMLQSALGVLARKITRAERSLERSYAELKRAPRHEMVKAAPPQVRDETAFMSVEPIAQ